MRVKRLTTWLVLGLAVALAYALRGGGRGRGRRRRAPRRWIVPSPAPRTTPAQVDGGALGRPDVEGELFVEALSDGALDPAGDLDVGLTEPGLGDGEAYGVPDVDPGEPSRAERYGSRRAGLGGGDLYGVHVVPAVDRDLPDSDRSFDDGETWLEHLETTSAELGAEPEHVLDMSDDSDPRGGHHKSATSDTPVADHGSGGPRGL